MSKYFTVTTPGFFYSSVKQFPFFHDNIRYIEIKNLCHVDSFLNEFLHRKKTLNIIKIVNLGYYVERKLVGPKNVYRLIGTHIKHTSILHYTRLVLTRISSSHTTISNSLHFRLQ